MNSETAAAQLASRRDELLNALDNLIEAAMDDQRDHLPPGQSARFQSELKKLQQLEEEGEAPRPILDAIREVQAMIDTVIPEIDSNVALMIRNRKQTLEKRFETLLLVINGYQE